MRIRVLGQYVPVSLAVLALIEVGLAFLALYAAVLLRFQTPISHLSKLEVELGPLWPRGLAFSLIVAICLLAFGLYSSRQRAQLGGIFVRLVAALAVAYVAEVALVAFCPEMLVSCRVDQLGRDAHPVPGAQH